MKYRSVIEVPCEDCEEVLLSLEPEKEGDEFFSEVKVEDGKIVIIVEADRLSMLQAGVNSYLRLLKTIF